jgi:hypothetical protein
VDKHLPRGRQWDDADDTSKLFCEGRQAGPDKLPPGIAAGGMEGVRGEVSRATE